MQSGVEVEVSVRRSLGKNGLELHKPPIVLADQQQKHRRLQGAQGSVPQDPVIKFIVYIMDQSQCPGKPGPAVSEQVIDPSCKLS
jgi:hypothetical protein